MAPPSSFVPAVSERRWTAHPQPSPQERRPSFLPLDLNSFVGRGPQLEEIAAHVRSDRLVTLVGGGGIGKTRLALQVARGFSAETDCVWTALSSTVDEAGVMRGLASAVSAGSQTRAISLDGLIAAIRGRQLMLVVDNCEQVIAPSADLLLRLLQGCPGIRVLATSREPLGVPGEVVYPVPPLTVTPAGQPEGEVPTEAVQLFFERAQARDPRLRSTPEARAIVGRICSACGGVPLAIELAAAYTSSMTVWEIAARLDDMLALLRLGSHAAPPRQRSVRASVEWSHRLLQGNEQVLLRRLALFDADFTLCAAEMICAFDGLPVGEVPYLLDRLVSQSMVRVSKRSATTSFCLWLPVRQFALEQLEQAGEVGQIQARMAECSDAGNLVTTRTEPVGVAHALVPSERIVGRGTAAPEKSRGRRDGGLSEREHAVVQLIARGRSNREIADELVITKKTAEAHVSHILTKLGLCSRVQIATWSLQNNVAGADAGALRTSASACA